MKVILVVDDVPSLRKLITIYLQARHYATLEASSGREALQLFDQHRPDLVILDHGLPDMTGIEVFRRIRQHASVPIVLITGSGEEELLAELEDIPDPPNVLFKPVPMPVLANILENLLK